MTAQFPNYVRQIMGPIEEILKYAVTLELGLHTGDLGLTPDPLMKGCK